MNSIVYSGKIEQAKAYKKATGFNISTHTLSGDNFGPTILVQIDFGNGSISLHLSPSDAALWGHHLKLAEEAAKSSEVAA